MLVESRPPRRPPINAPRKALPWLIAYLALIALPMAALLLGDRPRGGGFAWDFALAMGYAGLATMGLQFWLTARFKRVTAPLGIDLIYYFHRHVAVVAFLVAVLHALVLWARYPEACETLTPRQTPTHITLGWIALLSFALLIASSIGRKRWRIPYDGWRRLHVALAVLGVSAAVAHVVGSGSYLETDWKRLLWIGMGVFWLLLALWIRLIRPARLHRRPWVVTAVDPERGRSWTLTLQPRDGEVFPYRAGQFAWLSLRASPFALREHPFSIVSSPTRRDAIAFTIKALGDFTDRIGEIRVGETAYIDGPYGSFGAEGHPDATGLVFVAGGVGIAPIMSMLRCLADRREHRPIWLFYGNRDWERVVFREEIDTLSQRLDLQVVHVLGEPPADWDGETGWITEAILERHLPAQRGCLHAFVCGPGPMIRQVEADLVSLGLPLAHVHSELFDLA